MTAPAASASPGIFAWQFPTEDWAVGWKDKSASVDRWWGTFPPGLPAPADLHAEYPWAMGPFTKHGRPVLAPTPGAWDEGHKDGGVHNGSIVIHQGLFHYVYRGERPLDIPQKARMDYIGDIGLAVSENGVDFRKEAGGFFRHGDDRRYSFEDVNLVHHQGTYYLFCNRWLWEGFDNPAVSGTFLATSTDLRHWEKVGLVFPHAKRIHRNGVVLQDPHNRPVRVGGRFLMYLNDGLIAHSDDLIHWTSEENPHTWPGGEGCFALTGHDAAHPERILLFTGGNHTGRFYAIGEVLLSTADPLRPLAYLPRPVLAADPGIAWENGFAVEPPHRPISSFADCIFFNGLTRHQGRWWLYYGGSEYYTCLATAPAR